MQSRALPFNGSIGVTSYMGPGVLAGGTLTSPVLNLDVDTIYEVYGSFVGGASANIRIFFQSASGFDTTATNYDRAIIGWDGASNAVGGGDVNDATLYGSIASGKTARFYGWIMKGSDGTVSISLNFDIRNTSELSAYRYTQNWRTTGQNLIGFRIDQSTGSLTSGILHVFKKSPLTALNNATNLDVTANPSNPVHLMRRRRVDAATITAFGAPVWVCYDATLGLWLTEEEYSQVLTMWSNSLTGSFDYYTAARNDCQMYATRWSCKTYVQTTNNASNRWTLTLNARDSAIASTTIASVNTGATPDAANTVINHDQIVNALVPTGTMLFTAVVVKVGAPGNLVSGNSLFYRLVIP